MRPKDGLSKGREVSLFSVLIAQGAVWYLVYFYTQFFLEKVLKLESASVNLFMMVVCVLSAPLYVLLGALSDRVARVPRRRAR